MKYNEQVSEAVKHFWRTRTKQDSKQGVATGARDAGNRTAVTGGKQLDGFVELLATILKDTGIDDTSIHVKKTKLPGYFRSSKDWDLVVIHKDELLASIEFKSHVGPSFGNNFNNRVEEALGSATDILAAYREGAFKPSHKPWLGWLLLLEDTPKSRSPVQVYEPHFSVFDEFRGKSYAERYEVFAERLMREQLYDAACLLLSDVQNGQQGIYSEPNEEIAFDKFARSLTGHILAYK